MIAEVMILVFNAKESTMLESDTGSGITIDELNKLFREEYAKERINLGLDHAPEHTKKSHSTLWLWLKKAGVKTLETRLNTGEKLYPVAAAINVIKTKAKKEAKI